LKERNTVLENGDQWKEKYFQICAMKVYHLGTRGNLTLKTSCISATMDNAQHNIAKPIQPLPQTFTESLEGISCGILRWHHHIFSTG
jgi:hypothetical protein